MIDPIYQDLITPLTKLIQRIDEEHTVNIISIQEEAQPPQGASGSEVKLYTVGYVTHHPDIIQSHRIIKKNAPPLEQQVITLLMKQGQSIPPAVVPEPITEADQPVWMQYAQNRPTQDIAGDIFNPMTAGIASGLARIHVANRQQPQDWLPNVDDDIMNLLYLQATQDVWERCMQDDQFYAEFGQYDKRLKASLEQFLKLNQALTDEGDTLTLLNSDLNPDHIRLIDDTPVFIDWQQARYGSFYLDLVNYFSIETALIYRDALADAGYEIPPAEFMERFREVGHFMGLRYLEVGLMAWEAGGEHWQQGRWFFHYCLTMALRGR